MVAATHWLDPIRTPSAVAAGPDSPQINLARVFGVTAEWSATLGRQDASSGVALPGVFPLAERELVCGDLLEGHVTLSLTGTVTFFCYSWRLIAL